MELTLNGRGDGLWKVLFCYHIHWKWNIQEYRQTWTETLPDGIMGKERSPRGDCGEGVCSIGTIELPYMVSMANSSGRAQWANGAVGEIIDKQTSA